MLVCDLQMYEQCVWIILLSCNTCSDFFTSGSRPDLSELVRFRGRKRNINIPQEVGHRYNEFGDKLLKGHMERVQHIISMCQEEPARINLHILLEWLEGEGRKPVTWGMLVVTLQDIGLNDLAREIRGAKTTAGTADEPSPTPAPGMNTTHVHILVHPIYALVCIYMLRTDLKSPDHFKTVGHGWVGVFTHL